MLSCDLFFEARIRVLLELAASAALSSPLVVLSPVLISRSSNEFSFVFKALLPSVALSCSRICEVLASLGYSAPGASDFWLGHSSQHSLDPPEQDSTERAQP